MKILSLTALILGLVGLMYILMIQGETGSLKIGILIPSLISFFIGMLALVYQAFGKNR